MKFDNTHLSLVPTKETSEDPHATKPGHALLIAAMLAATVGINVALGEKTSNDTASEHKKPVPSVTKPDISIPVEGIVFKNETRNTNEDIPEELFNFLAYNPLEEETITLEIIKEHVSEEATNQIDGAKWFARGLTIEIAYQKAKGLKPGIMPKQDPESSLTVLQFGIEQAHKDIAALQKIKILAEKNTTLDQLEQAAGEYNTVHWTQEQNDYWLDCLEQERVRLKYTIEEVIQWAAHKEKLEKRRLKII